MHILTALSLIMYLSYISYRSYIRTTSYSAIIIQHSVDGEAGI